MGEIWYDSEEDILGIQISKKKYWKSVEVSENVLTDLSSDGEIIGIEILGAKRSFKDDAPLIVSKARSKLGR